MSAALFDTLRTVAHGAITGSFTTLGTALSQNWRAFRIVNNTNGDLIFSLDGTNDQIFVPLGSFVLYDVNANSANINNSDWFVLKKGSQFYVRFSTDPSAGNVFVEGIYSTGV